MYMYIFIKIFIEDLEKNTFVSDQSIENTFECSFSLKRLRIKTYYLSLLTKFSSQQILSVIKIIYYVQILYFNRLEIHVPIILLKQRKK